jgi:hypothetical protein
MSNYKIEKLKQKGFIYLWRYKSLRKSLLGWHITADKEGCKFIIDLIQLILDSGYSSKYVFTLLEADQKIVSVPNFNEPWKSATILTLKYSQKIADKNHWELVYSNNRVTIIPGENKLKELQKGFIDILNRKGDYAIGTENNKEEFNNNLLWFWWKL